MVDPIDHESFSETYLLSTYLPTSSVGSAAMSNVCKVEYGDMWSIMRVFFFKLMYFFFFLCTYVDHDSDHILPKIKDCIPDHSQGE